MEEYNKMLDEFEKVAGDEFEGLDKKEALKVIAEDAEGHGLDEIKQRAEQMLANLESAKEHATEVHEYQKKEIESLGGSVGDIEEQLAEVSAEADAVAHTLIEPNRLFMERMRKIQESHESKESVQETDIAPGKTFMTTLSDGRIAEMRVESEIQETVEPSPRKYVRMKAVHGNLETDIEIKNLQHKKEDGVIADAFEKSKDFAQEQFIKSFHEAKEGVDAYVNRMMSGFSVEAPWVGIQTLYTLTKKGLLSEDRFNEILESQKKKFKEAYIAGNKFLEGVSEEGLERMAEDEHKRVLETYKAEAEKMMQEAAEYINLENVGGNVSSWEEYRIQNRGEIDKFNQQLMQRIDQENENFKHPQSGGPGSGMWVGYLFEGYLRNPNIPADDIEKFVDWYLFNLEHPKLSEGFKDVPREQLDKYLKESGQIKVMKGLLVRELERSGKFDNNPDKLNELKEKIKN